MSRHSKAKSLHDSRSQAHKMFASYGHDCTLEDISDSYDWDYAPGSGLNAKIRRWLIRMVVVSESSKLYTHHLRSFGAITAERRRHLENHPYTIHPFSTGRIIWAIAMLIVMLYELTVTPLLFLMFHFQEDTHSFNGILNCFRFFFDSFLLLNIMVNFMTGYYDEPMQKVVLNSGSIAAHYLKTSFLLDLCHRSRHTLISSSQ
ncbi:hypothetical protein JTB14_022499 [Gonioctena quinquepunctata]|nr:hypothetical protein JTB14_022499 [Gonioctena quinquepunctata]